MDAQNAIPLPVTILVGAGMGLCAMNEASMMHLRKSTLSIIATGTVVLSLSFANAEETNTSQNLKNPSEFMAISDVAERSQAIFGEIGKVLTHPRCMNCHPAGNHPLQGADHHEHFPPAWRPESAVFADSCTACH